MNELKILYWYSGSSVFIKLLKVTLVFTGPIYGGKTLLRYLMTGDPLCS